MTHEIIPNFQEDGLLPVADYSVTFAQFRNSILINGPSSNKSPYWDSEWRSFLVSNLEILVNQLWQIGPLDVFIDGSFVEDKDHPNDIDGYFVCDEKFVRNNRLSRDLNLLDEHKIWTWDPGSRRPYRGYPKKQLPMWHQYRVELYPHFSGLMSGNRSHPPLLSSNDALANSR
ncbi:DUF6932 family protein [Acidiphilium acidophilum]|uniref:DUF6932 family protein n=1 Tax=Acidiphilium acidophilum TaxID=76588 RepID=UPI0038D023F9